MSSLCANLNWATLASEAGFQRHRLAEKCGVSTSRLNAYFVEHFRRPPQEWLDELRLWQAFQQVCEGAPIKAIAYDLGFKQVSHFSRVFVQYHGIPASKCRELYLKAHSNQQKALRRFAPELTGEPDWQPRPIWAEAQETLTLQMLRLADSRKQRSQITNASHG